MKSQRSTFFTPRCTRGVKVVSPQGKILQARAVSRNEFDDDDDYGEEESGPGMRFSQAIIVVVVLHVIAIGGFLAFNTVKTNRQAAAKVAAASKVVKTQEVGLPEEEAIPVVTEIPEVASIATHTIASGDTLAKLGRKYNVSAKDLAKVNNMELNAKLYIGQVLKLPKTAKASEAAPVVATTAKIESSKVTIPVSAKSSSIKSPSVKSPSTSTKINTSAGTKTNAATPSRNISQKTKSATSTDRAYMVNKGDNPYAIAKKLGVNCDDLLKVNGIKDPTKIKPGQKLKVPKK